MTLLPSRLSELRTAIRVRGFTLIELMISMTLGMIILGAIAMLFQVTSRARDDLEQHSRQVENGRFAIERIRDEVRTAGFFGEVLPISVHWQTPATTANHCDPTFGWNASVATGTEVAPWAGVHIHIPAGVGGINDASAGTPAPCVANVKAGTDILFVRRVDTNETPVGSATAGVLYLQNSFCSTDALNFVFSQAGVPDATTPGAQAAVYTLRPRYCGSPPAGSPAQAPLRRAHLSVFFVASCNDCVANDGIPTLKRLDYTSGGAMPAASTAESLVDGIETLHFEYGVDANDDGTPEVPFLTANNVTDWNKVVAIKLFVLSRGKIELPAPFQDTRTYVIGSDGTTVGPFTDRYRRQLMTAVLQLSNVANWRESY